jgi:hypothetical protein
VPEDEPKRTGGCDGDRPSDLGHEVGEDELTAAGELGVVGGVAGEEASAE